MKINGFKDSAKDIQSLAGSLDVTETFNFVAKYTDTLQSE